MKNLLLSLLLFPLFLSAQSENYTPLLAEDKHWIYKGCDLQGSDIPSFFAYSVEGTIEYEGQEYAKFYRRQFGLPGMQSPCNHIDGDYQIPSPYILENEILLGGIREDENAQKVYIYPINALIACDDSLFVERLHFDFAQEPGDTLDTCTTGDFGDGSFPFPSPFVLEDILPDIYHDIEGNRYRYKMDGNNDEFSLYEGVGSRLGIHKGNENFIFIAEGHFFLDRICIGPASDCFQTLTSVDNLLPSKAITISPSPSAGNFTVSAEVDLPQDAVLNIYDYTGKRVLMQAQNDGGFSVAENLPSGLYVLRVRTEGRVIWTGKTVVY